MFNPEAEIIARIEAAELQIRSINKRIEHAPTPQDKRVLNQQVGELIVEIERLKERLLPRPPRIGTAR
jgi:hypothetical protein